MTTPPSGLPLRPRWKFDDGMGETYEFRVNPNEMGSPWEDLNITAQGTTAPDGGILLTEGARTPKELTISGFMLDENQYFEMIAWMNKRRRVFLTDHFGRRMVVFIKSFNPTPMRRTSYKHRYDMTMFVLGEMSTNVYPTGPYGDNVAVTSTGDTTDPEGTTMTVASTENTATMTWDAPA